MPSQGGRKEGFIMTEKFCTKCGKKFMAIGRQVICPDCKAAAEEESKRTAVERAKRASWSGESVPVRISGRASTVIRRYGTANNMPFAQALDELLKASDFFQSAGKAWEDVEPYRSRRRDKATSTAQDVPQEVKQEEVKTAAKVASKATTSKATTSKPQAAKKAIKTTSKK